MKGLLVVMEVLGPTEEGKNIIYEFLPIIILNTTMIEQTEAKLLTKKNHTLGTYAVKRMSVMSTFRLSFLIRRYKVLYFIMCGLFLVLNRETIQLSIHF